MADIKIKWDTLLFQGDLNVLKGDIKNDNGLETAVLISLFTDQRANNDDELPDLNSDDRRGWWGDLISPDVEDDKIGSRLWLHIERAKTTENLLPTIKQDINDALQWMIDDKIAQKINVNLERQGIPGNDRLAFVVEILKRDGNKEVFDFNNLWENQLNAI